LDIDYRIAATTDVDTIMPLMRQYYAFETRRFDPGRARRAVRELLEDPSLGELWLIWDRSRVIGYFCLTFGYSLEYHGRDACLDELFIVEACRRMGVGAATMEFIEERVKALGIAAVHLEVAKENHAACSLYRRIGYEEHPDRLMGKRLG
jgi:ribosomal protein S18 acetylase RimI-like enzyme